jgi:hypothetical protein
MGATVVSQKQLTRIMQTLEGLMSRKAGKKKTTTKRRPEVQVAPEILSKFEAAVAKKICLLEGCDHESFSRGLCEPHLNKFSGQKAQVREVDGFAAAQQFDDDCVREGLILPRKFVVNPFATVRRSMQPQGVAK